MAPHPYDPFAEVLSLQDPTLEHIQKESALFLTLSLTWIQPYSSYTKPTDNYHPSC